MSISGRTYLIKFYGSVFLGLLLFCGQAAAAQSGIIYKSFKDHAEISVKIDDKTDYNVETKDNTLKLSFNKPYAEALEEVDAKLSDWVSSKRISSDGNTIILQMKFPIVSRNHLERDWLHLNIEKQKEENGAESLDRRRETDNVGISFGSHDKFNRFVFEFNPEKKPQYTVKSDEDKTVVSFLKKVNFSTPNLRQYPDVDRIEKTANKLGGTDFAIPEHLLQSFEYQNKLVLDFGKETAQAAPLKPMLKETSGIIRSKTILQNAQIDPADGKDEVVSLSFPWNTPVGLAVFSRGKYVWVIFDHHQKVDLNEIRKTTSKLISGVLEIPHNKGTVLRFEPKKNVKVGIRQEGLLWIIDFYTHNVPYSIRELPVFTQYNSLRQAYLYVPTVNAGTVISVVDPEVGDGILAAPNTELGVGISKSYHYPDLDILPAKQGFALAPITSDIVAARGNTGVSIRGYNRGLNISEDLETLKRRKLLDQSLEQESFGLNVSPQLLKMDFNTAEKQLQEDIRTAEPEKKDQARIELVKYYIAKGLGTNALKLLRSMEENKAPVARTDNFYALRGVANFLAKRYDEAIDDFSRGSLPDNSEAVFWRTLASSAVEFKKENNVILFSFISVMRDYPQELKERIAIIGAETAIKANDDITTQNFMDVLKSSQGDENRKANILYLNAQKFDLQGYPRNAVREYANVVNMKSQKYSSLARFEKAGLELKLGAISNQKAIAEYERLRYAWGEPSFKLKLLDKLASVYAADKNYYQALQTYKEALTIADPKNKQQIIDKMIKLFEDVYINNRADNMPPLKALALYRDFEWLAPRSSRYSEIVQRLADRLVAVDLLERAAELLKEQLRIVDLSPEQRSKIGTRLALIYLFQEDNIAALDVLDKTEQEITSPSIAQHRRIIRAKALSNLDRAGDALKLLQDDFTKNAILLKSDIYWKSGSWNEAADTIKYLIEKPVPGQKLSDEQISYILDWATALKKSGKETVIVRLRNKFLPYFDKTPYYSTFNVLTSNLEKDKIDLKAINQAVNDIAAFSNFSKIYNQSLREKTLDKTVE